MALGTSSSMPSHACRCYTEFPKVKVYSQFNAFHQALSHPVAQKGVMDQMHYYDTADAQYLGDANGVNVKFADGTKQTRTGPGPHRLMAKGLVCHSHEKRRFNQEMSRTKVVPNTSPVPFSIPADATDEETDEVRPMMTRLFAECHCTPQHYNVFVGVVTQDVTMPAGSDKFKQTVLNSSLFRQLYEKDPTGDEEFTDTAFLEEALEQAKRCGNFLLAVLWQPC